MKDHSDLSEHEVYEHQKQIAIQVSRLLRDAFGKGPESAHTKIGDSYVLILLKGFLSPMEQIIMEEQGTDALHSLRETMMHKLTRDVQKEVEKITGDNLNEFFFDWNIERKSGVLIGLKPYAYKKAGKESETLQQTFPYKKELEERISHLSSEAERIPDHISSVQVDKSTFLIVREGILVAIEKKLIEMGYGRPLKVAKRTVEKELLNEKNVIREILKVEIQEVFVDWNFEKDKSSIVIITKPVSKESKKKIE